jgi:hypothetical protein
VLVISQQASLKGHTIGLCAAHLLICNNPRCEPQFRVLKVLCTERCTADLSRSFFEPGPAPHGTVRPPAEPIVADLAGSVCSLPRHWAMLRRSRYSRICLSVKYRLRPTMTYPISPCTHHRAIVLSEHPRYSATSESVQSCGNCETSAISQPRRA